MNDVHPRPELPPDDPVQQQQHQSKIPRFVRNSAKPQSSGSSPVERKLRQQQQLQQQPVPSSVETSPSSKQDRAAKKLGHKKSHSVANLSKISVKDYHSSASHANDKFSSSK